jgi:hypothetical protein
MHTLEVSQTGKDGTEIRLEIRCGIHLYSHFLNYKLLWSGVKSTLNYGSSNPAYLAVKAVRRRLLHVPTFIVGKTRTYGGVRLGSDIYRHLGALHQFILVEPSTRLCGVIA